jgi:hypothetical protein
MFNKVHQKLITPFGSISCYWCCLLHSPFRQSMHALQSQLRNTGDSSAFLYKPYFGSTLAVPV